MTSVCLWGPGLLAVFIISPTHKRTEGRAPVWGSEFTLKDAALQGGSSRNRCYAERKIVRSAWLRGDCVASYRHLAQTFTQKLKANEERAIRGVIRGCWFMLLYFAPCRPLPHPRCPLPLPLSPPAA